MFRERSGAIIATSEKNTSSRAAGRPCELFCHDIFEGVRSQGDGRTDAIDFVVGAAGGTGWRITVLENGQLNFCGNPQLPFFGTRFAVLETRTVKHSRVPGSGMLES